MSITATTKLNTDFGVFTVNHHEIEGVGIVSLSHGNLSSGRPLVRIQSACLFGQSLHSRHCNCRWQLDAAMSQIGVGDGVIVFSPRGEGKGAGLAMKIRAMDRERETGCGETQAFLDLGLPSGDLREFSVEARVLQELGVSKRIRMPTENEKKRRALLDAGFESTD